MGAKRRKVRRLVLWLACPASVVLALLVVWWSQQSGVQPLTTAQAGLVLGLIVLPGATGAAVLVDRSAARRARRAHPANSARSPEALPGPVKVHAPEAGGRTPHGSSHQHAKAARTT
ncbi:MAG: hypothetical protein ACT4PL_10240 [Phycisphaerales bacterium]